MKRANLALIPGLLLVGIVQPLKAQQPSYARDVKPFFARYCLECHNAEKNKGGLNLETFQTLAKGGDNGPVLVRGKAEESRLVLAVEGKGKPAMPPKKAKQPRPEETTVLRTWIAAGAKDDSATLKVAIPDIKPRVPVPPPVAALAYHPSGKLLSASGYREVTLIDVASGDVAGRLSVLPGGVTALAFSPNGQRLAVASGAAATVGELRLYPVTGTGLRGEKPEHVIPAHRDLIHELAWNPDGKTLATCSYDRLIKLWDVVSGKEVRVFKDHSDAVYGVAFSPDGSLLASAAADRAVKVWDVATGVRLYTLGEATDWVYAVAWSPSGRFLAAAGVDKSIRIWEAGAAGGRLVHSVFAHEGPITRLVYTSDGKTLYSLSDDRTIKAWDTERMVERKVYPRQPEAMLSLAIRADQKQLALGRYDGTALFIDTTTGQVQSEPLPIKPKPPQLIKVSPQVGQRGRPLHIIFEGKYLDSVTEVIANFPGVTAKVLAQGKTPTQLQVEVTFPALTPAAVYPLILKGPSGQSESLPFTVDLFPEVPEKEPNDSPRTGQKVTLPATLVGAIGQAGDVDFFRFEAQAGQEIGVQALTSAVGSSLDPVLQLTDGSGHVLVESTNGLLAFPCEKAGTYALGIHDREYRGGSKMYYRLHAGDLPVVREVFPLGLQRGTEADVLVEGVNLGNVKTVRVRAPAQAEPGTKIPIPVTSSKGPPLGVPSVIVGEFPERIRGDNRPWTLPIPGTANGRLQQPGATDTWRFPAKKGQRLILEVNARRLGLPLDSFIEILDGQGQPVPRAVLRCLAKTYSTFRDHDSVGSGIRIETWSELAMNDYLLAGSELLRIWALPKNPDDDCQFFSSGGQRLGFLDTTPTHHSLGTPMYKVAIHPPGTTFAPNGLPVVTLYYRNDDGGPGYGKDSRLFFDPPVDGEYQVRIGDSRGQGGNQFAYRLTVRPPRPSFQVSFNPTSPSVWKGGAIPISVSVDRTDGFEGAIEVRLDNLPPGFSAPPTTVPAGENNTSFALWADATATAPASGVGLKLVARAKIDGNELVREVTGGLPKVVDPGDLMTFTEQSEVTVIPGQQVRLTAKIERRNGVGGRVPVEVRGLPHGVQVLDIGLNGILITEKESSRTFVIYAEPWVQPMAQPFVVLARHEGKGTEHAARSVLLKVKK